jgi:hypothetical protein
MNLAPKVVAAHTDQPQKSDPAEANRRGRVVQNHRQEVVCLIATALI